MEQTDSVAPMEEDARPSAEESGSTKPRRLRRWLPLAALVALTAFAFALGVHEHLSFKTIGLNYELLKSFIDANLPAALVLYMLVYIAVVALSLPGGLVMTVAGGLLFGWKIGAPATVFAATIGATIIFVVAKTSLGEPLAAKAGPWLGRLREGFRKNALSYLLFLRLVPAFPFVVVNLAPALLGVPLSTFVLATFIGIIPGTIAFSVAGAGLGSVVEAQNRLYHACAARHPGSADAACPYTIDTAALVTRELLAAFVLLGVVALIPIALKKWRKHDAAA
jgi:uncharacterized membrane protein YdjX (TVP38/TMEM64 family)